MPAESTKFKGHHVAFTPKDPWGLPALTEAGYNYKLGEACEFLAVTGNGSAPQVGVSDVTYNQAANITLYPDYKMGAGMKAYASRIHVQTIGQNNMAGGNSLTVQDTAGGGIYGFFPLVALQGNTDLVLPQSQTVWGQVATVSSYAASTGVMTFGAGTFNATANLMANCPFEVIGGTGAGLVNGIVSANTSTTVTPAVVPVNATLDNTSVVHFPYQVVTSASAATNITCAKAAFPTSVQVAQMWAVVISGTGAGQVARITSNTATALTVETMQTQVDNTSVVCVTSNPALMGSLGLGFDIGVGTANKGVAAALNGTFTGSTSPSIRVRAEGYQAA